MHGVRVSPIDIAQLRHRVARLQILAVYQQAEEFFWIFHRTHPRRVTFTRRNEEDVLTAVLRTFDITFDSSGQLEVDLFHCYRLARNLITHSPGADSPDSHRRVCDRLRAAISQSTYHKLSAPNPLSELQFDDFVLFTRSLKQLASNLCTATAPTDDEYVEYLRQDKSVMRRLRALANARQRSESYLVNYLRTNYSLSVEHAKSLAPVVLDTAR